MAADGATQDNVWPLPKFHFTVKLGSQDNTVSFQEISGLETETLKKGVFVKDNNFFKWYDAIKMNTIKRETVTIQLLDEGGKPTMTWTLINAWPTKISSPDMKSDANEVAVETLELAHEGLTIANA
jgi:hypothetical protein